MFRQPRLVDRILGKTGMTPQQIATVQTEIVDCRMR